MAATFPTLSFDSVCVDIQDKRILWDVSGRAEKGEILAIMGPSGECVRTSQCRLYASQENIFYSHGGFAVGNCFITACIFIVIH